MLAAAKVGWMLDAMDFMLYAMALGQLRAYFEFGDATAGFLGTATLVMSGVGGLVFGYVADRFGRTRALMGTIVIFSLASLGAATSQSVLQLLFWRAVLGIGMGGEWASGAVLVSETWPPQHRNKAISIMQSGWAIGYIAAAVLAACDPERPRSRRRRLALAVRRRRRAGAVRALDPAQRARVADVDRAREADARRSAESVQGHLRPRSCIGRTLRIIALGGAVQFAYWGLFFWLPPFLSRPVEQGGAGMGVVGSLQWIVLMQVGAYLGYLTFGFIADRLGRRRTFVLFMLCAAAIVPVYGQMARSPMVLLVLSPLLGYFGHGYFSMFGSLVAELFPTAVRATGQGTSYNVGRMAGAIAPFTIGAAATLPGIGIGLALGITSAFFLAAALLVFTLPDRSGQALE